VGQGENKAGVENRNPGVDGERQRDDPDVEENFNAKDFYESSTLKKTG
jgi:hypothetical protein